MTEPEIKPKADEQKTREKQRLFDQAEVNYTAVSMQMGKACAGCRWFEAQGDWDGSSAPSCNLVYNWPQSIQPTGLCDRYEAYPAPEPLTVTPMPVVIIDPDTLDTGSAEVAEKALLERVWSRIKERIGLEDDTETVGFKVVGNHFLAVYSNNFKDRDGEFFPEHEIDAYVSRVDMGVVPKPELWVWHGGAKSAIGSADQVWRHGHFTFAAGQFYGSAPAQSAKAYYTKHSKETGLSHGFKFPPDKFSSKSYRGFNTFEITLLPRGVEANWYTSLEGVKAMAMDEKKKAYFEEVFGKEHAARILEDWDKRGKALEELDVAYKDFVGTGDTLSASANKQAVDLANKSFAEIVPDLMEGSAESVLAATEALKGVAAEKAARITQDGVIADLQKQLKEVRAKLDLAPRSAASDPATALDTTTPAGKALLEKVTQQLVEVDPFTGLQVIKS